MIRFYSNSLKFVVDTEDEESYVWDALDNIHVMMREYFEDMPYVDYTELFEVEVSTEDEEDEDEE